MKHTSVLIFAEPVTYGVPNHIKYTSYWQSTKTIWIDAEQRESPQQISSKTMTVCMDFAKLALNEPSIRFLFYVLIHNYYYSGNSALRLL